MVPYTCSFLLNTAIQLFSDNLSTDRPSLANLTVQAMLITPQGFLIGLIYIRSSKNIFSLYADMITTCIASKNPEKAGAYDH